LSSEKGPDLESRMSRRKGVTPRSAEKRPDALSAGDDRRSCNWSATKRRFGQVRMRRCNTRERTASGDGGPDQMEASASVNLSSRAPKVSLRTFCLANKCGRHDWEILDVGSQPDSVLSNGHAQRVATEYETSTAGQSHCQKQGRFWLSTGQTSHR
jgi:hypothetical protein